MGTTEDKYLGKKFNEWTPIEKINSQRYLCRCSCGIEKIQYIKNVASGSSKSCGHERRRNIVNQKFGAWTVLKELGEGKVLCKCACGTERELYKKVVISGQTKSCGCYNTSGKLDILDQRFGSLVAKKFIGNSTWECLCDCGNTTKVSRRALLQGLTKSCGCKQSENMKNTMMQRYNDIASVKIVKPREKWQIEVLHNKERLQEFIAETFQIRKPTVKELANKLGVNDSTILKSVHTFALEDIVDIETMSSQFESEICDMLYKLKPDLVIERNTRSVLSHNRELDIYLPDYKLAIEFNGTYWHKYPTKPLKYHQDKTFACRDIGIRLIHIFEYEWVNEATRNKIEQMLHDIVLSVKPIYARNLYIDQLTNEEAAEFINRYHLQNAVSAEVNLALKSGNEIIQVMTFGRARFDKEAQYELLRLCTKSGVTVIGGAERLIKYFITEYSPESIVSYCNISKFTGEVYNRIGFKYLGVTTPNYVWVSSDSRRVLTRYQCQKSRLVKLGLGTEDETENSIMEGLGYYKVYDSGNNKYAYTANKA